MSVSEKDIKELEALLDNEGIPKTENLVRRVKMYAGMISKTIKINGKSFDLSTVDKIPSNTLTRYLGCAGRTDYAEFLYHGFLVYVEFENGDMFYGVADDVVPSSLRRRVTCSSATDVMREEFLFVSRERGLRVGTRIRIGGFAGRIEEISTIGEVYRDDSFLKVDAKVKIYKVAGNWYTEDKFEVVE